MSSHLFSSHLISSRLISSRLISSYLIPSHLVLTHRISSRPIASLRISSYLISPRLISSRCISQRSFWDPKSIHLRTQNESSFGPPNDTISDTLGLQFRVNKGSLDGLGLEVGPGSLKASLLSDFWYHFGMAGGHFWGLEAQF